MTQPLETEYYDYNHGTGEHYLVREVVDADRPRCSWKCFCNHFIDFFCISLALGFLLFSGWLVYYLYNNADSGDRRLLVRGLM
jgi:hypothetical protein